MTQSGIKLETLAVIEPRESAQAAGLRYVTDATPGIRRCRVGHSFRYLSDASQPIHDQAILRRITALRIPQPGLTCGSAR